MATTALAGNNSLFVPFRDRTSGKRNHAGGRFLEADEPKDGRTILDFNKAANPYCASSYSDCMDLHTRHKLLKFYDRV